MNATNYSKWKKLIIVIALFMLLIEIPGAFRTYNIPYAGFWTDGQNTIIKVFPQSPAEKSGLKKGDYILKSGGIDMEDIKALSRRPRSNIGDKRIYTIKRDSNILEISVTSSKKPLKNLILDFAGTFIGLCIIIFCLLPYFKIQTKNTLLIAIAGLGLGFSFLDLPSFSSLTLRIIRTAIWTAIVFWGLASILHFMLSYPKPKKLLSKKYILLLLYGIPVIVFLFFLAFNIFQPNATHFMRTLSRVLLNDLMTLYLVSSLIALVHSYVTTSVEERKKYKLNLAFWGFAIGIAPILISSIFFIFLPAAILPGSEFYFLFVVIIPITMALSVLETESAR